MELVEVLLSWLDDATTFSPSIKMHYGIFSGGRMSSTKARRVSET